MNAIDKKQKHTWREMVRKAQYFSVLFIGYISQSYLM
jgi:hypothetical protein